MGGSVYDALSIANEDQPDLRITEVFWDRFKLLFDRGVLGGTTQEEVARALGTDQATVNRLLKRKRPPTLAVAVKAAVQAGVELDWLLGLPRAKPPAVVTHNVDARTVQRFISKLRDAAEAGEKLFSQLSVSRPDEKKKGH